MDLPTLIPPERILTDLLAYDRWPAIEEIVAHLVATEDITEAIATEALTALLEREERISTGIGQGVAIPHAFLEGIPSPIGVLARSLEGVEFESLDNAPVEFIVLILAPVAEKSAHLATLAAFAKTFQFPDNRDRLRDAATAEIMHDILTEISGH